MNTTHTPGPWKFNEDPSGLVIEPDKYTSGTPYVAFLDARGTRDEKTRYANARLIAAAPALLAALDHLLEMVTDSRLHGPEVLAAARAIAAAKGTP